MKHAQSITTAVVLANAAELTTAVLQYMDTDSLAQSVAGSELSRRTTCDSAQVYIQQEVNAKILAGA